MKKKKVKKVATEKDNSENEVVFIPIFMSIGLSIGVAIGAALGNIPLYMSIGLSIGVGIGAVIDTKKRDEEKNKLQDENKEENE